MTNRLKIKLKLLNENYSGGNSRAFIQGWAGNELKTQLMLP